MFFRYVQMDEHGKWIEVAETPDIEEKIKSMGAVRSTALSVSELITDDTDHEAVKYKGPLYFDIDADDLDQAIDSTRELVSKLQQLDVPDEAIKLYCSGNKGFHIFVPEKVFMESKRAVKKLPAVYMELAKELYVYGMDFAVYSGGKGRMFRPENGQHPSKGTYRVRISLDELASMTAERYQQLVAGPRYNEYKEVNGAKAYSLAALYERAKTSVGRKQALRDSALPVEELKPYAEDPPACVPALMATDKSVHFNQAGMQLAIFIARAGVPKYKAQSLIDELATKKTSTTYDSFRKRRQHLDGLISYTSQKPNAQFSCAAMRSLTGKKVCRDCPLTKQGLGSRGFQDRPAVLARADGYYVAGRDEDRQVSTFTLHPIETYVEQSQGGGTPRRIGTKMQIQSHGEILGHVKFDETGWRSRSELLKQFEGISNLGFLGNDTDVQKIKIAVYPTGEDEVEEITKVHSAGIYESATSISGKKIYTYVEPGMSVNSYGIKGTHELDADIKPEPRIRMTNQPEPNDPVMLDVLRQLMAINSPLIMAQLIGWHSICHLKAHIMSMYTQFPSLNLWGNAGSGKSMTSSLMTCLNGVDYMRGNGSPLLLSMITAWPLIDECASTTTIPKVLEEFNQSKIKKHGMYEHCVEIMKAAFNGYAVSRGRLAKSRANGGRTGAEVINLPILAPLVICSEQAPMEPALQQRMIQVKLSNQSREGRSQYYLFVSRHRSYLLSFARAMMMTALKTKENWIGERLEASMEFVPEGLNDRAKFSYALLFVGLDYFHAVAHSLNLDLDEEIQELKQALIDQFEATAERMIQAKVWTEVDQAMSHLADMAQLALQDNALSPLQPGKHFLAVPERDELLVDMQVIFPLLKMWANRTSSPIVFSTYKQMVPLLLSETYCVTDSRKQPELSEVRNIWVFRLSGMERRGHNIGMFSG